MQVYREIPVTTNQARRRPAELVGVVSVTEEWTVAHHREAGRSILERTKIPFVLDAGTGMYLNALLLNIPLAPKVDAHTRHKAAMLSEGSSNPRRASREIELDLVGAGKRRSIWDGVPIYETAIYYIRPDRPALDERIKQRSNHIIQNCVQEAESIHNATLAGIQIRPQVLSAIGIREILDMISGNISKQEAKSTIEVRTRQLARRQMRWFDKLIQTLTGIATIEVATEPDPAKALHTLHDTMIA